MNYCSLEFTNPEVQDVYAQLKNADSKDSLINLIGGSEAVLIGLLYETEAGEFHLYQKSDVIELLNRLKADSTRNPAITDVMIDDLIRNYNERFAKTKSNVLPDVKLNLNGVLVPIISASMNEALRKDLFAEAGRLLTYDSETHYIPVGADRLNSAIKAYKNRLFQDLIEYVGATDIEGELYDVSGDDIPLREYYWSDDEVERRHSIMYQAWEKLLREVFAKHGKIDQVVDLNTRESILKPIKALYVLNDFDNFITTFSAGQIIVKDCVDKLEVFDKYTTKEHNLRQKNWKDDTKNSDATDELSGKFYIFWQAISDGKGGYLTKHDFHQVRKFIENYKNDTNETSVKDSNFAILSQSTKTIQEKSETLIDLLKNHRELRRKIGEKICDNIVNAFESFRTDYLNAKSSRDLSIEDRKILEHDYSFTEQAIFEMLLGRNSAYQEVTIEGSKLESNSRVSKGKLVLNDDIENHIRAAFENGDYYLFNPRFILPGTDVELIDFTNIYSDAYIEYVRELTGIDLMSDNVRSKVETPQGAAKLAKFLVAINKVVKQNIYRYRDASDFEVYLKRAMSILKTSTPDYIDFTNFLIDDNLNNQQLLHGQSLETLPGVTVANTVSKFAENWEDFKKNFGTENSNLFSQFTGLTQISSEFGKTTGYTDRIVKRQDYATKRGSVAKYLKGRQLVAAESATIALNYDFLDSICKYKTFLNQIECVSDKPSIPLGAFNMSAKDESGKSILTYSESELFDSWYKLHVGYYSKIRHDLISDYSKLFEKTYSDDESEALNQAIEDLEKLTYEELYKRLSNYNNSHPNNQLLLVNQIHFVESSDGFLKFSSTLYTNIKAVDDKGILKALYDEGYKNFKKFLADQNVPIVVDIDPAYSETYRLLCDSGYDFNFSNFAKQMQNGNRWVNVKDGVQSTSVYTEKLLKKFFILQQLCTDADLQISIKDPIIHTAKRVANLSINTLKDLSATNLKSSTFAGIFEEYSDRLIRGKKRNNALVASYLEMAQGLDFGVGNTMNIAFIESPITKLVNYNGDRKKKQETHDGGGLTNPIFNVWEKHSYLGRNFGDTKKAIGLFVNGNSFTQVKYADFVLSNYVIKNSFETEEGQNFDGLLLMRKMNNYDATHLLRAYNSKTSHPKLSNNLYTKFDGHLYKILDFEFNPDGISSVTWESMEGLETKTVLFTDYTVYGLWNAFGGADSMSSVDGKIEISDASCEIVADLISLYAPDLKTKITAKLVDKTGCKSCDVNLNPLSSLYSTDVFQHYVADTSRMGIQQDASHEADESQIPALTLVLTALAFNGENVELVNEIYETLGDILEESLKPLRNLLNLPNKHAFNKYVAEKLFKSLQRSGVQSNALSIVIDSLEEIYKDKTGEASIPYSSRQLFSKIASDFISGLNNDSLRQKFAGIAIVQNPSHGIIGIWEDPEGIRYTRQELEELAYEYGYAEEQNPVWLDPVEWILDNPKGPFAYTKTDTPVDVNDLSIGDNYRILDPNLKDVIIESGQLSEPEDYLTLELRASEGFIITRDYRHQRDLRACNITFTDTLGAKHNFWTLDSTRKKIKTPKNKFISLYYRANIRGIGDKTNPFYFADEDAFRAFMQAGGFDVADNNIGKTFIVKESVVYKAGEQIIPNVNRTKQGIDKSVSYILRHPEYFESKVRQDLENASNIHSEIYKIGNSEINPFTITLTNGNKEIVYTTNKVSDRSISVKGRSEDNETWLYNSLGEKILQLPYEGEVNIEEFNANGKQVTLVYLDPSKLDISALKTIIVKTPDVQAYYFNGNNESGIGSFTLSQNDFDVKHLDKTVKELAKKLYNSFKLSLQTISARIPSQSFQSFMANDTVSFIPGNTNDGYVNIWLIWFQGSDYDIKL